MHGCAAPHTAESCTVQGLAHTSGNTCDPSRSRRASTVCRAHYSVTCYFTAPSSLEDVRPPRCAFPPPLMPSAAPPHQSRSAGTCCALQAGNIATVNTATAVDVQRLEVFIAVMLARERHALNGATADGCTALAAALATLPSGLLKTAAAAVLPLACAKVPHPPSLQAGRSNHMHTPARTHACTQGCTHARRARTHTDARTNARTHPNTCTLYRTRVGAHVPLHVRPISEHTSMHIPRDRDGGTEGGR